MKNSTPSHTAAVLTLGLLLAATTAHAQATIRTFRGVFKSSDGDKGTYVRTTTKSDTSFSTSIVFTRDSDQATRIDTENRTTDADGNRAVTLSDTDFGATAAYTAQKTVTKEKHGQFVGQGTYTTPTGDTGVLTTLESKGGFVNVYNAVRNSVTTGVTQILDLTDREFGFTAVKRIVLTPDGVAKTTVTTRYITDGSRETE